MKLASLKDLYMLLSDPNALIFVTGPSGAGKSTLVSNLSQRKMAIGVHPGAAVRANKEMFEGVRKSVNPTAPGVSDNFVKQYVEEKVKSRPFNQSVAVDGMPRSVKQVCFCVDLALRYKMDPVYVFLSAPKEVLLARVLARGDDPEFARRRVESDLEGLSPVYVRLKCVAQAGHFGSMYEVVTGKRDAER